MLQQVRPGTPFPGRQPGFSAAERELSWWGGWSCQAAGEQVGSGRRGTAESSRDGRAAGRAQGARVQLGFRGRGNESLGLAELRVKCCTHRGSARPVTQRQRGLGRCGS